MSDLDGLQALLKILAGNYEEIRRCLGLRTDEQEDQAMVVMERVCEGSYICLQESILIS